MIDWEDDIKRYRNHEMTPEEEHAFEKKALNDPFLAEALEGLSLVTSQEFSADMAEVQLKMHHKTKRKAWLWPLRLAASVALVVFVYFAMAPLLKTKTDNLAQQIQESNEPPGETVPSLSDTTLASEDAKEVSISQLKTTPAKEKSENSDKSDTGRDNQRVVTQSPTLAASPEIEKADEKAIDLEVEQALTREETKMAAQQEVKSKAQAERVSQLDIPLRKDFSISPGQRMVQGTVLGAEDNTPIPGVNILIKGTQKGTITDINGNYKILVDSAHSNLVFTFIGLQTQEVNVTNQSSINIKLQPDVAQLSEVVVTGYSAYAPIDGREPIIKLAEPVGGRRAYDKYLHNSIQYPQQALDNKIKGRVTVQFIVRRDGSLDEFSVLKGLGYGCDEEVIRLVKDGPRWSPTTEDSVPIESEVRVRVKFALPE